MEAGDSARRSAPSSRRRRTTDTLSTSTAASANGARHPCKMDPERPRTCPHLAPRRGEDRGIEMRGRLLARARGINAVERRIARSVRAGGRIPFSHCHLLIPCRSLAIA